MMKQKSLRSMGYCTGVALRRLGIRRHHVECARRWARRKLAAAEVVVDQALPDLSTGAAIRADLAAIEKREQRLSEYRGRATRHDSRYACDFCGSSHKFTLTTVCAMCGGRLKVAARPDTDPATAIGSDLDAIGRSYGTNRSHGETDQSYRHWIEYLARYR